MKPIDKFHFLIHGFCWAGMCDGAKEPDARTKAYLKRERCCAEGYAVRGSPPHPDLGCSGLAIEMGGRVSVRADACRETLDPAPRPRDRTGYQR
jgi:hypothetical protein